MNYNLGMTPERKAAYRHLIYLQLIRLRSIGGSASGGPPSFWFMLKDWRWHARGLYDIYWLADSVHNLAWFSVRDFEGFDEERFWNHRISASRRWEFLHFEARMRRQIETWEWMPKSFTSTREISQCFQDALKNGRTPEGYARLEEAMHQIDDFPIDYKCVLAGVELVEKTTESKMRTGPYLIVFNGLSKLRYEDTILRAHKEKPDSWVLPALRREYERQRGTLRA